MAAAETARLIASLELQDKNFTRGIKQVERGVDRVDRKLGAFSGFVNRNVGRVIDSLAVRVIDAGTASVKMASELEQSVGAIDSVFGKSAKVIEAWGQAAAEAAGLSQREVNELASVTGAQLQSMGFEVDEAAEKAIELQKRAADLAATFGGTTLDAMEAITALMRGERDPIERYGVSLKQADVTARVLALGLDTSTTAAKKQAEAIASLDLLFSQTKKSQGQFARETDSLAGQQAKLKANLENTGASIGRVLLPQLSKIAGRINKFIVDNQPAIRQMAESLPGLVDAGLRLFESILWESVGASLQIAGTGAKAILDAFLAMPPWVQTAVITGWGLNKLTGGAVGSAIGSLIGAGIGKLKGVLGIQAGVVNVTGGVVNTAGGIPGAVGGAGGLLGGIGLAKLAAIIGLPVLAGAAVAAVAHLQNERTTEQAKQLHETQRVYLEQSPTTNELKNSLAAVDKGIADIKALPFGEQLHGGALAELQLMRSELSGQLGKLVGFQEQRKGEQTTSQQKALNDVGLQVQREGERTQGATNEVKAAVQQGLIDHRAGERGDLTILGSRTTQGLALAQNVIRGSVDASKQVLSGVIRSGDSMITSAIRSIPAPITNVIVNVTATKVTTATTKQERSGPGSGSRNHGTPGPEIV